jgi:hypothetical protein
MTPTAGECTTPESVLPAKYVGGASRRTFGPFRQFSSANNSMARDMTRLAALGLKGIAVSFVNYLDELPYFAPRCCRVSRARGCAMAAQRRADRPLNTRPNCLT